MMRTNDSVDRILRESYVLACEQRHPYYTPEHVLYVALGHYKVQFILEKCRADVTMIRSILDDYFKMNMLPPKEEPHTTQGLAEVLQIADYQVRSAGRRYVEEGSLLYSLSSLGEDSFASYALHASGLQLETLLFILSQITEAIEGFDEEDFDEDEIASLNPNKSIVDQLTVNLTQKARDGKIEPLIGRKKELERTIHILCRKTKNNPLHVGEPGVGKTAITLGLASRIVAGDVPDLIKDYEVLSLQMSAMVAGTRYRGDFEERIQRFLEELVTRKKVILFIDEIHTIIGAGSSGSGGQMDASNILKPLLATGDILCIGATTYEEYEKYFTKEKALLRRFHKIDVEEPSAEDTLKILEGLKSFYEEHHGVTYTNKALSSAISLSQKYMRERFLPDKAIDLIDEAGALTHISTKKRKFITEKDIESVIAKITKLSPENISLTENLKLLKLEGELEKSIFGQEQAVADVGRIIKRAYVGLKRDNRPMGAFLFVGPTGVGKTELSQTLAKSLDMNFVRIDMSEYQEKHSVSRLIGSPPGYVGHEEGGLLTDAVRRNPHSVVLLDEVEKAHPDIYSILLQVMDYATLTDSLGRKADFRNAIVIMTSNLGISDIGKSVVGFGQTTIGANEAVKTALNKFFKPEFRNRLDKVVTFNPLSTEIMGSIVSKELASFSEFLTSKKVKLVVEDSAQGFLTQKSYNIEFGARYVNRIIEDLVKDWFVEALLKNQVREGQTVTLSHEAGQETLSFQVV